MQNDAESSPPGQSPKGRTRAEILQTLASSSSQMVQLCTLVVVAVGSVASLFQGAHISESGERERAKAAREIHDLYLRVDDFERRQQTSIQNQNELIESNIKQVKNQGELLRNAKETLDIVHQTQQRLMNDKAFREDRIPPF
jgi:hypothetical protein